MSDPVSQSIGRMLRGEQHIGDTRDMTMRERLARASHLAYYGEPFDKESQSEKDDWRRMVDAILRELMEPSEGMLAQGARSTMDYPDGCREATCWVLLSDAGLDSRALAGPFSAMIRHIIDEGLPTADDVRGILSLDEPQQEDDAA